MDNDPNVFCGNLQGDSDHRPPLVKVLHVFGRMSRGGAEIRTLELMRKVHPLGLQFHFCVLSGRTGELDRQIQELGGTVHLFRLGPGFHVRFKRLLSKHRYDVVHSHVHYFSGYIMKLAWEVGIPTRVVHFRTDRDFHGNSLFRRLYRRLMKYWIGRYANRILAVSNGSMTASWGEDWREDVRCRVIYNGLDPQVFMGPRDKRGVLKEFGLPEDCRLCIHVGKMIRVKNHERLISIFAKIAEQVPKARLLLVGEGDNDIEIRIRKRITQLGLTSHVAFSGERNDVPRLLKAADLLIFPSLWEGLPGVCLEAFAAGTPVLASDLPGIREIAEHFPSVHYLGLDRDDSEWALLANTLLDEHNERRSTDASVREFSNSLFSLEKCATAHLKVWKANFAR